LTEFSTEADGMGAKERAVVATVRPRSRLRVAPPESPDVFELAERGLRATIGLASVVAEALAEALARTFHEQADQPVQPAANGEAPPRRTLPMLAGTGLLATLEAGRFGVRLASAVGRSVVPWTSFATSFEAVRDALERGGGWLVRIDDRWRAEQRADREIGASFVRSVVRRAVEATLDQLDLTELVLARIDVDRIVDAVDVERIVVRVEREPGSAGVTGGPAPRSAGRPARARAGR
jgi:hypothetical protein